MQEDTIKSELEPLAPKSKPTIALIATTILVNFGTAFTFAYPANVINPSVHAFSQFVNASYTQANGHGISKANFELNWAGIVNAAFVGAFLGALVVPFIADKFGRKPTIIVGAVPFMIGAMMQVLAIRYHTHDLLAGGRFVAGLSTGMLSSVTSVYLTECAPLHFRGIIGACQALMIQWLSVLSSAFGLPAILGDYDRLEILVGIQIIPALILFIGAFFIPESPKYLLIAKHEEVKAMKSIEIMHGPYVDALEIMEVMKTESTGETHTIFDLALWKSLFTRYKWNLAIGCVALMAMMFSGLPAIMGFSTHILVTDGMHHDIAPYVSLGMIVLVAVVTTVTTFMIERTGRRNLLFVSLIGVIISGLVYVVFDVCYWFTPHLWGTIISTLGLYALLFMIGTGVGIIPWFVTNEILPFQYRSAGQTIAVGCMYIIMTLSAFAFFPFYGAARGFSFLVIYSIPSIICSVFLWKFLPETKGREASEVAEEVAEAHKGIFNNLMHRGIPKAYGAIDDK